MADPAKRIPSCSIQKEGDAADILTIWNVNNNICIDYSNLTFRDESEKMTYEDAITYLENHAEMDLFMENFVTLADVEHIERLINIQRNKIDLIGLNVAVAPTERLLELCMERSLVIDENEILFWFDQTIYQDFDGSEALHIDCKLNSLRCTLFRVDGFLYNRLLFYIKATKNRNLTIEVKLKVFEGGFEKLFADLGWPWTDQIANWNNDNRINREITLNFEGDSNSYRFVNDSDDEEVDFAFAQESGYFSD